MTSKAVERAAEIQRTLQEAGYEVSRHASSMIILADGKLAATLHVYLDACKVNIYMPWARELKNKQKTIINIIKNICEKIEINNTPYGSWNSVINLTIIESYTVLEKTINVAGTQIQHDERGDAEREV